MSRSIYIDLGSYTGDTIKAFYGKVSDPEKYEVYAFEPNPDMPAIPDVHFLRAAAWIADTTLEFTVDKSATPMGSTVMQSKRNWGVGEVIKVPAIDFSAWIKQFEGDYVIVKCDIEGAEFLVLEKMLTDNTIGIMSQLWVEMHPNKVKEYTTEDAQNLLQRVRNSGVIVEDWH